MRERAVENRLCSPSSEELTQIRMNCELKYFVLKEERRRREARREGRVRREEKRGVGKGKESTIKDENRGGLWRRKGRKERAKDEEA